MNAVENSLTKFLRLRNSLTWEKRIFLRFFENQVPALLYLSDQTEYQIHH